MAQHDYNIANQSGADFRSDLNNALSAIASTNSGDTSPTTTFANQLWIDTANNVLKIRNEGNSAWITIGISITADNTFNIDGGTVNGITALSFSSGSSVTTILDEDNLGSDSATALATQQSIKAYVDSQVGSVDTLAEILSNGNTTGGTDISLSSSDITGTGNINITGTIESSGAITGTLATAAQTNITSVGALNGGSITSGFGSINNGSSAITTTGTVTFGTLSDGSINIANFIDDDTFGTASATTVATSESIKAYVDSQVATADSLAEVLANGNTTGGTDIAVGTGDDITFANSSKAIFGAGSDLQIYHDGSNANIVDTGTGDTYIQGSSVIRLTNVGASEHYAKFNENGAVELRYDNGIKFATTSTGIDVTGVITTDGITTSADINFGDNDKAIFGAGSDLEIYHDGSASYIEEKGTGSLFIIGTQLRMKATDGTTYIEADDGGAVTLKHNGATKIATTSTGIDVTGTVTADGLTVDGTVDIISSAADIDALQINDGTYGLDLGMTSTGGIIGTKNVNQSIDIKTYGGASTSTISNYTNNIKRFNIGVNGDISFYDDTGSTQGLFWDASAENLGLGDTAPQDYLEINGSGRGRGGLTISNSSASHAALSFARSSTATARIYANEPAALHTSGLNFQTSDASGGSPNLVTAMVIDENQNVGIGSTSVRAKLDIVSSTSATPTDFNASSIFIEETGNNKYGGLTFVGGNNNGVTGTVAKLLVQNTNTAGGFEGAMIFSTRNSSNSMQEAMRIDSSQNVLVGTTASVGTFPAKLEILGDTGGGRCINTKTAVTTSANAISFNNGNGQVGTIVTNGSATAYNTSSDARLKDVTGEARGLEVINELNPVSYNWKADGKADEGLIAQEVQEIVPNAVSGSEEEMYQMDYSKLVVHLVKAVKEQQEQIESLKGEIANLKGE